MNRLYVDANIAKANTLATDFYTTTAYFEASKEKIFASSRQHIGSKELVKFTGDVQQFTLLENYLNEPLLLTKDKAGNINCLSNVCTHRGNILAYKACSKSYQHKKLAKRNCKMKKSRITYWIVTGIFAVFMLFSAIPIMLVTSEAVTIITAWVIPGISFHFQA